MPVLLFVLLFGVTSPAIAEDDINAKVSALTADWQRCINEAADIFALQPEPVETILVGVYGACAKQERALAQFTGGDEDDFGRKLRAWTTPKLTARILVARSRGGAAR